ncbi:hypothetical protein [Proteiniphilum propionicum]|uniref:hypothetical protein n=1 Tax=Proteiniphilum propionicum TaxID=2829812 RepID=UPI001EEC07A8|nr:hypothetical protein [Proteiniphilum propionicum]ULB36142.1 hypothetical protein KDN43_03350 [Proteiniphilum propionicum]
MCDKTLPSIGWLPPKGGFTPRDGGCGEDLDDFDGNMDEKSGYLSLLHGVAL